MPWWVYAGVGGITYAEYAGDLISGWYVLAIAVGMVGITFIPYVVGFDLEET